MNSLKNKLIPRDKEKVNSEDKSSPEAINSPHNNIDPMDIISITNSENGSKMSLPNMVLKCKQEDANSAKSDVLDSDSPHCNDGNNLSSFIEPTDSDFSQDEEDNDNLSHNLLTLPCLPKVEDVCYDDPHENSCNFGFPVEDQTFCFWPY